MKRRPIAGRPRGESASSLAPVTGADSAIASASASESGGTAVAVDRDVDAVEYIDWPARELGAIQGFRDHGFQVVFRQSVLDGIHLHGQSITDIEVCGVLIGTGFTDAHGPYLLVEHCIRGIEARGQSTNVTFTAETWKHIQETMDRDFPDKKMVGWYHTHPGFGIFLSGMDQFICDNFFNLPWQVAFVYDPISGEEGNFLWRAGKTRREQILIEDDVTPKSAGIPLISVRDATGESGLAGESPVGNSTVDTDIGMGTGAGTPADNEEFIELLSRVRRLEKRQKLLMIAFSFLAVFVVMCVMLAYELAPAFAPPKPAEIPGSGKGSATPAFPAGRPAIPPMKPPVNSPPVNNGTAPPML